MAAVLGFLALHGVGARRTSAHWTSDSPHPSTASYRRPRLHLSQENHQHHPGAKDCTEKWFNTTLDHFRYVGGKEGRASFPLRYLVNSDSWGYLDGRKGPIFFYAGNEADVSLYADNTGMMWESAGSYNALLVFAEHRYYGKSLPFGESEILKGHTDFLSTEQALADYAALIVHLRQSLNAPSSPVVVFGGSYGGVLAALLRLKYPHLVVGAIASSAPMGAYMFGVEPPYNPASYWETVTFNARKEAGSDPNCIDNVKAAFKLIIELSTSTAGLEQLSDSFKICTPLGDEADGTRLAYWAQAAFDAFAMGNYPFPSAYMLDSTSGSMPAWPMQAACEHMGKHFDNQDNSSLLKALRKAVSIFYDPDEKGGCFELPDPRASSEDPYDYQWCTQMLAQELPYFPATGDRDMFWDQGAFDMGRVEEYCVATWGVKPDRLWAATYFGGAGMAAAASNIVFTNGQYDPWSTGGVMRSQPRSSVVALLIPQGAHHVDLMFGTEYDPPSFLGARALQRAYLWRWMEEAYEANFVDEEAMMKSALALLHSNVTANGGRSSTL